MMQAQHVMDHYGIVFKFQKNAFLCVYNAFLDEDAMPSTYILSIHTCWGSGNVSETHIYRHHTHITCTIGRHTCVDTCVFSWPYITCILFNMEWSRYTLMKVPKMTPKYREPVAQHSPRFAITKITDAAISCLAQLIVVICHPWNELGTSTSAQRMMRVFSLAPYTFAS